MNCKTSNFITIVSIVIFSSLQLRAQNNQSSCISLEYEQLIQKNVKAYNDHKKDFKLLSPTSNNSIVVPVVIHVIDNEWYVAQFTPDSVLFRMIADLNDFYAKRNYDTINIPAPFAPLSVASNISFCLATVDPNGMPTTGILRITSTHPLFVPLQYNELMSTTLGGHDPWPFNQYLNIYVGGLDANSAAGFASHGYAAVTCLNLSAYHPPSMTLTHEIAHCFGLDHTWGGPQPYSCNDDDGFSDTPTEWGPANYNNTFPLYDSCTNNGAGIMFMNFMDYAGNTKMFTQEQVDFMEHTLMTDSDYAVMIASNRCANVGIGSFASKKNSFSISGPVNDLLHVIIGSEFQNEVIKLQLYDQLGKLIINRTYKNQNNEILIDLGSIRSGMYYLQIYSNDVRNTMKVVVEKR